MFSGKGQILGESPIPKRFSSLSLMRAMAENTSIPWDAFWNYFARLSLYRYHLLPISDSDMFQAVFPPATSGIVTSAPKNIRL